MNILDENIPIIQHKLLRSWRVPIRHFGYDIGRKGMKDEAIIPFLLRQVHPTFFTFDWDFFKPKLRHARYCLVYLEVERKQVAMFVRRVLRHPRFNSHAKRMGSVLRVADPGVVARHDHAEHEICYDWKD